MTCNAHSPATISNKGNRPQVISLLVVCAILLSANPLPATEITCGWESYAPYQFTGEDGTAQGLDIELTNAIAERAGVTVRWVEAPWKRQLLMIEQGTLDLAVSASHTPEREAYAAFSVPYRREEPIMFIAASNDPIRPLADLDALLAASDFRLGIARGYVYSPDWEQRMAAGPACTIIEATTEENLVRILAAKRIDGALLDRFSGSHMIRELGFAEQVVPHGLIASSVPIHIMASKTSVNEDTLNALNAAIEELEADGTLDAIRDAYASGRREPDEEPATP